MEKRNRHHGHCPVIYSSYPGNNYESRAVEPASHAALSKLISSDPEVWPIQVSLKGQRQGQSPSELPSHRPATSACYSQNCHQKAAQEFNRLQATTAIKSLSKPCFIKPRLCIQVQDSLSKSLLKRSSDLKLAGTCAY